VRLATIIPENSTAPTAAVAVDAQNWIGLHAFLNFFGEKQPSTNPASPLAHFLPVLMPRFFELTRKVSDWPEHGRIFLKRGGKTLRARRFLPPILRPPAFRDFYAFEQHARTMRARLGQDMVQAWYERPVFYFSNPNSLVGPDAEVFPPEGSKELDFELELGLVIGNRGRNIRAENAWNYVAGFTIINDFSARDLQRAEVAVGLGPAKGKDFATATGPVLVTRDEFADKIDSEKISLEMRARLNGQELSRGNSNMLFHTFPRMIAQASRDADLFPGDLIGSGTIGMGCIMEIAPENTGGWLKAGDVIELDVERIGTLRTKIAPRPSG
jgi:fumarylacetoacetate (FAA) hydrolase